jgi:hypothetical protein
MVGDKALLYLWIHPSIDAADSLHQANGVPVDVIVDHSRRILQI